MLRAERQDALEFGVLQQLFMYKILISKLNSAQGEALSSFGVKIAVI